ncbi:MAG TPA: AmmeMemoRadiSam system protein B, partial [Phycisphaerales bacterium]|nr:AmmeMemoRadiSam system protein B [Phycisphaerales bacterium]
AAPADPGADEAGVRKLREFFDQCIERALEKAERPSLDQLPRGIIAPHLDYGRGWINYAAVYGRLRVVDRPDRVVILGTNHFGQATGVCGCDKGFTTPLGTCAADQELIGLLRAALGEKLFADRFDHEREHSVELQVPWVQHVFGKDAAGNFPRVFAALVHDPAVSGGESYDGNGIALDPFVQAMKKAISELPGRTLVISSADLSHVGSSFGDQTPVAGDDPKAVEFRNKVVKHDQEMLQLVLQRKPAELVATLSWLQNPTRWCSLGNLVAAMLIADPAEVEIFNYGAALDQQGLAMVSSVAAALK